jgi:hypothetical protein
MAKRDMTNMAAINFFIKLDSQVKENAELSLLEHKMEHPARTPVCPSVIVVYH